ncbi:MAG: Ig-like domain-containing protein [Lachnospiraceae bacterium]|nr:Ig-like domain-containing protein [Lachnospiraceae bacterium]
MRLQRMVGTVNLFDDKGEEKSLLENMQLHSGNTLQTDKNLVKGTIPVYTGTVPTKPSDSSYNYEWSGWIDQRNNTYGKNDTLPGVKGTTIYTATFIATPNTVSVTGVSLNQVSINMLPSSDPVELTATIQPDNATNKNVTWNISNSDVAELTIDHDDPLKVTVTAKTAGSAEITVTTEDGGYTKICPVIVRGSHYITPNATGGKILTESVAFEGETVTLTLTPDNAGKVPDTLEIKTVSGQTISYDNDSVLDIFTFTMPDSDVTITASFKDTAGGDINIKKGSDLKRCMAALAGDNQIKHFQCGGPDQSGYNSAYDSGKRVINISQSSDTSPVYMWFDNNTIFWYSISSGTLYLDEPGQMFEGFVNIKDISLQRLDMRLATDLSAMFKGCENLTDLTGFNVYPIDPAKTDSMFQGCKAVTILDLRTINFHNTSFASASCMFKGCTKLKRIIVAEGADNGTGIGSAEEMFASCSSLVGRYGTSFDVEQIDNNTYAKIDDGSGNKGYFSYTKYHIIYDAAIPGDLFSSYKPEWAEPGDEIVLTVSPGYIVSGMSVSKSDGSTIGDFDNNKYTFTMPADNVTVTATVD